MGKPEVLTLPALPAPFTLTPTPHLSSSTTYLIIRETGAHWTRRNNEIHYAVPSSTSKNGLQESEHYATVDEPKGKRKTYECRTKSGELLWSMRKKDTAMGAEMVFSDAEGREVWWSGSKWKRMHLEFTFRIPSIALDATLSRKVLGQSNALVLSSADTNGSSTPSDDEHVAATFHCSNYLRSFKRADVVQVAPGMDIMLATAMGWARYQHDKEANEKAAARTSASTTVVVTS